MVSPGVFRALPIDEIVVEGLDIGPPGLDWIEFDAAVAMEIGFAAIKPGRYSPERDRLDRRDTAP